MLLDYGRTSTNRATMINEAIDEILEKAYTKNWDDFFILAFILHAVGTFVLFLGWFKMPVLLDYLLFLPPQILGSMALIIYLLFTKESTV
jgi:Zn-dependent protease with chaperone function